MGSGVSANLCDAITKLGAITPDSGLEIGITWSKSRTGSVDIPTHIRIAPDALPLITEASRIFRETEPQDDFQLVGFIEQLHRPETRLVVYAIVAYTLFPVCMHEVVLRAT